MNVKILGLVVSEGGEIKLVSASETSIAALLGNGAVAVSDRENLAARTEMAKELLGTDLDKIIASVINEMGIPAHIKGYKYIQNALHKIVDDRTYIENVTKMLYPEIALIYKTTPSRVERAIRHAIEASWSSQLTDYLEREFNAVADPHSGKMTNSQFLATIGEGLRVKYSIA